jgi:hypothetical protein
MRTARRSSTLLGIAAAGLLLSGCSTMADNARSDDLCTRFEQMRQTADDFRQKDATHAQADEIRAQADKLRDQLNQLQAVAEGRLDTAITNLEAALDDVRQAANDAGTKAQEEAKALYKDDLEAVAQQWVIVREAVAVQCQSS